MQKGEQGREQIRAAIGGIEPVVSYEDLMRYESYILSIRSVIYPLSPEALRPLAILLSIVTREGRCCCLHSLRRTKTPAGDLTPNTVTEIGRLHFVFDYDGPEELEKSKEDAVSECHTVFYALEHVVSKTMAPADRRKLTLEVKVRKRKLFVVRRAHKRARRELKGPTGILVYIVA